VIRIIHPVTSRWHDPFECVKPRLPIIGLYASVSQESDRIISDDLFYGGARSVWKNGFRNFERSSARDFVLDSVLADYPEF
jgi:hypothetical protein